MDSVGLKPDATPVGHRQPLAPVPQGASCPAPGAPPKHTETATSQGPADAFQAQTGLEHLAVASLQDLNALIAGKGDRMPDRIAVVGKDLVIGYGSDVTRASLDQLAGLVSPGGLAADTMLGRSLLVFEAANRAHLPPSGIKAVLNGFAESLKPPQSLDGGMAMHQAFAQVSMASLVEAYVQAKDGLATDVRRVASFVDDAFHPELAGGALPAMTNRTVGKALIADRQKQLDAKLQDFTAAFSDARFNGDYSAAFDSLQTFFRTCAGATDSLHWKMRAADPSSACPPLPAGKDTLPHSRLLDAALQVPLPVPKAVLIPTAVAKPSRWQRFTTTVKTVVAVVGSLFSRAAPMTPKLAASGLIGVDKARDLVTLHGSDAAFGRMLYDQKDQPTVTEAEALLVSQFGDKAASLAKAAAAKGHLSELVQVAEAAKGHPAISTAELQGLIGSKPSADGLGRLASALRISRERQTSDPVAVKAFAKRLMTDAMAARLAPLANDVLAASAKPSTLADINAILDKVKSEKATGKSDFDAARNALRPAVLAWVGNNDSSMYGLFNSKASDDSSLRQFLQDLRALPATFPGRAKLAVALLPAHLREAGMARSLQLMARDTPTLSLNNADVHRILTDVPAGPAFERCLDLLPHAQALWPKGTMDGLIALSQKLGDKQVPAISDEQAAQARKAVYGVKPPSADSLVTLLDSRVTGIGITKGPYTPVALPTVGLPAAVTDLTGFKTTGKGGDKSVSPTQWFVNDTGERFLVKLADPTSPLPDTEPFGAAMERQISVLGNQLGLPVNVVQVVPVTLLGDAVDLVAQGKLQEEIAHRAQMAEPALSSTEEKAFVDGITDAYKSLPFASVHKPVGQAPLPLFQVVGMLGLPDAMAEYRAEESLHCDSGQGCSAWMRPDATAHMQAFKDGIQRQVLDDGSTIARDALPPHGRTVVATHTYRIGNPEVLDQVMAFDRLVGNADRHGGNLLLVPKDDEDGKGTTYTVHLIDHGRSFYGGMDHPDVVAGRIESLSGYLKSLSLPENATHAANVLPLLRTFANLSETQLLDDPYAGLPDEAVDPQAKLRQQAILAAEQQLVREYLGGLTA